MSTMGVLAISRGNSPYLRGNLFPAQHIIRSTFTFYLGPVLDWGQSSPLPRRQSQGHRAPAPSLSPHIPKQRRLVLLVWRVRSSSSSYFVGQLQQRQASGAEYSYFLTCVSLQFQAIKRNV